jgi:Xaa-Pro aminopeptidase
MEPSCLRLGGSPDPLSFGGHGVGLEVNELPLLSKGNPDVIQAGTVVTLEIEKMKLQVYIRINLQFLQEIITMGKSYFTNGFGTKNIALP